MFKLVVLSVLLTIAAAAPGYLHGHASPLWLPSAHAAVAIHEPALAHVGSVVKSIPTAVSHQSISQVHSSAHIVQPIVAPIVKTSYAAAPLIHHAPLAHALPLAHGLPSAHGWAPHGW